MAGHTGRNRALANGGPRGVHRSYASALKEHEGLFNSYEHLQGLPRADTALTMLRKMASLVKPIMRKRNWKVQILSEFLPPEQNLLGLNINKGYKICIRLRYHNNTDLFLPMEQIVDTMLHELSHIIWGEHDGRFHALWDELRDEHETLLLKGYTGEGFLSEGQRLGGDRYDVPPTHEIRRLARASAEKRKQQGSLTKGSGQRLGGTPLHKMGLDMRQVIADQVTRRTAINKGCASGRKDADALSNQTPNGTFKTKAEEDDANDRAIAQALYELMEQEQELKLEGTFSAAPIDGGLAWTPEYGLYNAANQPKPTHSSQKRHQTDNMSPLSEEEQLKWALEASMNGNEVINTPTVSPMTPNQNLIQQATSSTSNPRTDIPSPHTTHKTLGTQDQPIEINEEDDEDDEEETPHQPTPNSKTSSLQNPTFDLSEPFNPDQWTCQICTCINPIRFLACDACATERPQPSTTSSRRQTPNPRLSRWSAPPQNQTENLGWTCARCETFMERQWWTCAVCGLMKGSS
ncbi:Hypothetical protein R9X50_00536600 [Acrodontium crateriforme]|uniref:Zinc metallopeptidase n=1 Tax=Acrodontium crateriforme TaxID=150365 RepID=A0AAQ3M9G3_9PEZI|nr:Hypothetical protein R9X50_00536600 [Acrodontium crateriforme]